MSIRRWFNGIFRPDEIETDKATVNGTTTTDTLNAGDATIEKVDAPAIQVDFTQSGGIDDFNTAFTASFADYPFSIVNQSYISLGDLTGSVEGVAYNPDDGHIYVSEDTEGQDVESSIYKYDTSGALLDTIAAPSGARHIYHIRWIDGYLWAGDYQDSTGDLYKIDFESESVEKTITTNGAVDDMEWVATVPSTTDKLKFLFAEISSNTGYLVDLTGAESDGQTDGNIETPVQNEWSAFFNGGLWKNGEFYWQTHNIIVKTNHWFADEMGDGFPITTGRGLDYVVDYDGFRLEGLTFNNDSGEWVLADSIENNLMLAEESSPGEPFTAISSSDVVSGGVNRTRSVEITNTNRLNYQVLPSPQRAVATAWIYDDLQTTDKEQYCHVHDSSEDNRHVLAIKTTEANGDVNYHRWNPTDSWEDTGVARPNTKRWVGFRWFATGGSMELSISTDLGVTWQSAGSKTVESTEIQHIGIQANEASTGEFGEWTINPQY